MARSPSVYIMRPGPYVQPASDSGCRADSTNLRKVPPNAQAVQDARGVRPKKNTRLPSGGWHH